jgi:hypothetical protein
VLLSRLAVLYARRVPHEMKYVMLGTKHLCCSKDLISRTIPSMYQTPHLSEQQVQLKIHKLARQSRCEAGAKPTRSRGVKGGASAMPSMLDARTHHAPPLCICTRYFFPFVPKVPMMLQIWVRSGARAATNEDSSSSLLM